MRTYEMTDSELSEALSAARLRIAELEAVVIKITRRGIRFGDDLRNGTIEMTMDEWNQMCSLFPIQSNRSVT